MSPLSHRAYSSLIPGKSGLAARWIGELPGLSGASFYDLYNDPREVQPKMLPMFPTKGMFASMKARHEIWKLEYPDSHEDCRLLVSKTHERKPSKPRFNKDEVPFDVEAVMKKSREYENFEVDWGIQ